MGSEREEVKTLRAYYVTAAVLGTVLPYYYLGSFAVENGFDVRLFVEQIVSARASLAFVIDLFISSFAFWPFLFQEAKRRQTPSPWLFVLLNLAVGLSCALPLFLYFREKKAPVAALRA
ncbi:MAG: DUF2834 domain-containing protein [Nitrospirae bacterium]|nr:DUF2834 domain-containing protein [Nitrospirota bacterium]